MYHDNTAMADITNMYGLANLWYVDPAKKYTPRGYGGSHQSILAYITKQWVMIKLGQHSPTTMTLP